MSTPQPTAPELPSISGTDALMLLILLKELKVKDLKPDISAMATELGGDLKAGAVSKRWSRFKARLNFEESAMAQLDALAKGNKGAEKKATPKKPAAVKKPSTPKFAAKKRKVAETKIEEEDEEDAEPEDAKEDLESETSKF